MIYCDLCPRAYHADCYIPPLLKVPRGKWYCHGCIARAPPPKKRSGGSSSSKSRRDRDASTAAKRRNDKPLPGPGGAASMEHLPQMGGGDSQQLQQSLNSSHDESMTSLPPPLSPAHSVASATFEDQQHTNSIDSSRFQAHLGNNNNGAVPLPEDVALVATGFPVYPPPSAFAAGLVSPAGATVLPVLPHAPMQFGNVAMSPRAVTPTRTPTPTPAPTPPPPGPLHPPVPTATTPLLMQASPTALNAICQSPPQQQHQQQQPMTMPSPRACTPTPPAVGVGSGVTQMSPPPINIHAIQEAKEKLKQEKKEKHATKKLMKELAVCKTLLAEMELHEDSWPFLLPVNTKQFPTYRKIIKSPMDLSTIKKKLHDLSYKGREDFCVDVRQIFDNCEMFNEDDSPVGKAGHGMRKFFESRWTELTEKHS
ncbi:pollen-specific leucine-rich repeat extensin-like protein 3 isoform X2 [Drosophila subobscura]|nr:pollen-specific leucine-rich repeat extensin-like protein 3 isoform X2 [Drosophila subobscura]